MKKTILALALAATFVGLQTQTAQARDCAVGAVLGGIVAGAIIADAFQPHTTVYYSQPAPVYYSAPAPVYYAPPACEPRVVYAAPAPVVVYREPVAVRFGFGYVRPWHYRW